VWFVEGDIYTVALDDEFDADVGRFIFIYNQDKVALLHRLARPLGAGDIVAFQEPIFTHPGTTY